MPVNLPPENWVAKIRSADFHGRPLLAAFALANAAFLAYTIVAFIGLRESWDDLALAVTAAGARPAPARARRLTTDRARRSGAGSAAEGVEPLQRNPGVRGDGDPPSSGDLQQEGHLAVPHDVGIQRVG